MRHAPVGGLSLPCLAVPSLGAVAQVDQLAEPCRVERAVIVRPFTPKLFLASAAPAFPRWGGGLLLERRVAVNVARTWLDRAGDLWGQ